MKRDFCIQCFLALNRTGNYNIQRVPAARSKRIICWRCHCRGYGSAYEISRKRPAKREAGNNG